MIIRSFDEVVLFARTGLNPRTNFKLGQGTNKYITIKNIRNNSIVIDDNTDVVDDDAIKLIHKRSQIKKGDILFCSIGRMGDMYIIPEDPEGWDINESVFAFTLNTEIVRQKYFYYIFKHQNTLDFLNQNSSGSTFKSIKMNQLKRMLFKLPPIEEQDHIISLLDSLCAIIEARQQQLQKLDELVKARFVEMFGEHDVNGYSLKDCCVDVRGGSTPSMQHPEYYGGNIPFIKSGDVRGDLVSSGALWLTEKALMETPAKYVPKGSILIVNRSAALLREFRAAIATQPVVINQDIKAFIPKPNFVPEYLLWAIKIQSRYLLSRVTTVLTSHIDLKDLLELEIAPVSTKRQAEFSKFVYEINKTKTTVQDALDEAQLLFDILMQKYFG